MGLEGGCHGPENTIGGSLRPNPSAGAGGAHVPGLLTTAVSVRLPVPSQLQRIFHSGSADVRPLSRRLARFSAAMPLPPLAPRRIRPALKIDCTVRRHTHRASIKYRQRAKKKMLMQLEQ